MKKTDFFVFDTPENDKKIFTESCGISLDQEELLKIGIYQDALFPIKHNVKLGTNFNDIIDTTSLEYLISEKVKTLIEENHLTGYKTYPVKILDKKRKEISGYYGLSITGTCNFIDYTDAVLVEKPIPKTNKFLKYYKGISVQGWDGSDFFTPKDTLYIMLSEKAAKILHSYSISNLLLIPAKEYSINASTYKLALAKQLARKNHS